RIGLRQAQDSEAGAIAHLRMWLAGKDGADDFRCRRAHGFAPVNQARRRPLEVSLMAFWHVLSNGRVPVGCRAAGMGGNALATMEHFNAGCGVTGLELLTGELIGNAVVMPVDLDVIIDIGPDRSSIRPSRSAGPARVEEPGGRCFRTKKPACLRVCGKADDSGVRIIPQWHR